MSTETFAPGHFVQFLMRDNGLLDRLEEESVERGVNIVGPSVGSLLYVLAKTLGARRVLELGTANGYSTIWLARALPPDGRIVTFEWEAALADEARANLEEAGESDKVKIVVGDAMAKMGDMEEGEFDLVFMDIEKEMYSEALPHCVRLLRPGGMLFCDNVAFVSSGDFNQRLSAHPELETSFIYGNFHHHSPDDDALSISVRR